MSALEIIQKALEKVVTRSVEKSVEKAFAKQNYELNLSDKKIIKVLSDEKLKLIMVSAPFLYFLSPIQRQNFP